MSGETIVTIAGNLVAPAELRFSPSGAAVADFTVASTPRVFKDGAWSDGPTLFMRCSAWRELAENIAESLDTKGTRVIVQGRLVQRSFETREGEKRTVVEMQADEVGPSLKHATAKVARKSAAGVYNGNRGTVSQAPSGGAADDPWSVGNAGIGGQFPTDEPAY